MSQIHYLRELAATKKRIVLFTTELNQLQNPGVVKRNENSTKDIYIKILNELRSLKMSSVIRYEQQYSALLPGKSQLATMLVLRILKEKHFLRRINAEIRALGGNLDFSPVVFSTPGKNEYHPIAEAERILRENAAAHSMLVDCYEKLIGIINQLDGYSNLRWLLKSLAVAEQNYTRNEQRYWQVKIAA